ncbi:MULTISPECIES: translation initiation factor IF-2 [unclassified Paenibacillus]|uniref:translation initiation factor IF-2 n=2 Tax=unclassified Paenibacillus TaxID=185978 RepID=UPI00020D67E8|nr:MULTISPECIES: translation initiation factor IF-2 [unclassified Paenibacillus]EGL19576.1 translation initiation factor IF-2 [Paenibacillus sp. HGF7]
MGLTNKQDPKDKLRVYEYAKSLNMSSKEIITILKRLNIPVNNHMSVMENNAVSSVEKFFRDIKANAAAKRAGSDGGNVSPNSNQPKQDNQSNPKAEVSAKQPVQQAGSEQAKKEERPAAQARPQGSQDNRAPRPSGDGRTGAPRGDRPQGQGAPRSGGQGGGQRPQGGQGGYNRGPQSGGQGRPQGGQRPQGQGGAPRSGGQGGGGPRPQGGQGGGFNRGPQGGSGGQRPPGGGGQGGQNRGGSAGAGARPGQAPRRTDGRPAAGTDAGRGGQRTGDNRQGNRDDRSKSSRYDDGRGGRGGAGNRGGNNRGGRNNGRGRGQDMVKKEKIDNTPKKIIVRGAMTVGELAKLLHKDVSEVIKKLLFLGVMATINQELDLDTIQLVAGEYNVEVDLKIRVEDDRFELEEEVDDAADLKERPPVVTIMGHVDHGKTTLLDAIRHTSVTEGEAGGITQHIGAYQVEANGKKITFLDTPGHEAFTTMRARGAQVTDITIIVVAADDGVMPQTVEAIAHAKAAGVPIIVAVNKIDKPEANVEKIKQALTEYELVPEEWGGDTIFCEVSAKQRIGLENLLEMILLVAEVQEYKANPDKRARGTVIEAELDKGRGPVARILVQHGTLKVGDSFVAGVCFGRVRAMVNDKGKRLKEAGPSTPVEITGLTEVPQAGDPLLAFEDERKARDIADKRAITLRQSELTANSRVTLDDLYKHIKDGEIKDLNVIIKADVQGSLEALRGSLEKIEVEGVRVKMIHTGVGAITESDIILASASNAIIIGFNVRPEPAAQVTADQEKVDIRLHRIIYNVIEEIEQAMKGMLDPIFKENIIGHAEVRNTFKITGVGTIAGCMVTSGKIARNAEVRLLRSNIVVYEGKVDALKRFKDDAKEVAQGYECGISLEKYNDIKEGDIIEAFVMETVER